MSSLQLRADQARLRHPQQYQQLIEQMRHKPGKTSIPDNPDDWTWSYDTALRVKAHSFADILTEMTQPQTPKEPAPHRPQKGRPYLEDNKNDLAIDLCASVGRRIVRVPLDNNELLAGPDDRLPVEALHCYEKPPGAPVWLWREETKNAPAAWHEHVLTHVLEVDGKIIMSVQNSDCSSKILLVNLADKTGKNCLALKTEFSAKQAKAIMAYLGNGASSPLITPLDVDDIAHQCQGSSGQAQLAITQPSIHELLEALSGPGFMAIGAPMGTSPQAPLAPQAGPWIDWNDNLSDLPPAPTPVRSFKNKP